LWKQHFEEKKNEKALPKGHLIRIIRHYQNIERTEQTDEIAVLNFVFTRTKWKSEKILP